MRTRKTAAQVTAYVLVFIMVLASMVMVTPQKAEAASAKRKISRTAVRMDIGKSCQLHVLTKTKGTTFDGETYYSWAREEYVKKFDVKWSSSNKKVATVTQKGKVTGKARGTATITAKVGKTSYKCRVTVLRPISRKNIKIKEIPTARNWWAASMFAVTNKNDWTVEITYQILYTNKDGKVERYPDHTMIVGSGETARFSYNGPDDFDYGPSGCIYKTVEFKITDLQKSRYRSAIDDIEVWLSKDGNTVYVKNNANFTVRNLDILFYKCDADGKPKWPIIMTNEDFSSNGLKPGKTYKCRVNKPDSNWLVTFGTWVKPDSSNNYEGYYEPGKPDLIIVEQATNEPVDIIHVNY